MQKIEEGELSKLDIAKLILVGKDDYHIPLVLEIGAYDGKDSRELSKSLDRESLFYCFEADKRSQKLFNRLNKNSKPFLNLYTCAIGNVDGIVNFNLSDSETRRHGHNKYWSASSSLKEPKTHLDLFKDVDFKNSTKVSCIKLDTWFKMHSGLGFDIDFIWCDINGAEEDFILGGLNTLQNNTRYLYIEFSDKELYKGQITKDQILELLPNFELIGIYNFLGNFGNLLLKNKTL